MLPTPLTDTPRGRTAARITPRPWRPRPSLLVVGLVLVLASVVGVGALIHSVSGEHGILVMSQTVQAGQVITAGDLEVVNVSEDMGGLTRHRLLAGGRGRRAPGGDHPVRRHTARGGRARSRPAAQRRERDGGQRQARLVPPEHRGRR